jgi:hypothetical protein
MNKTILLAAAALVSTGGSALAGSFTAQLTDYCDEYTLSNNGSSAAYYAIVSDSSTCDPGIGGGTEAKKVKGTKGKLITTGMILNGTATEQYVWTFTAPKNNAGEAALYYTTNGTTLTYLTESPYTVVTAKSDENAHLPPATKAARN